MQEIQKTKIYKRANDLSIMNQLTIIANNFTDIL